MWNVAREPDLYIRRLRRCCKIEPVDTVRVRERSLIVNENYKVQSDVNLSYGLTSPS